MLFVFQVDTGRMMTFDMSLALETVQNLKVHVEQACKIPAEKQVLLISGGEHLDPSSRVCSYPAGTDTNPIFLFSKAIIELPTPPSASFDYAADYDLTAKVKECSELQPSYQTVIKRAQLAQSMCEVAKEQIRICERLVHEQHLQHQGWSAVIANLEDLGEDLKHRVELYRIAFHDYMTDRESYLKFLSCFKDDLEVLERIPVLPALLPEQQVPINKVPEEENVCGGSSSSSSGIKEEKMKSLHSWISEKDDFLDHLFDYCKNGLAQMDEKLFNMLETDIDDTLKNVDNPQYKQVQGLGDRLSGLEELMRQARILVQEQIDLAHSFIQNKNRATNLQEPTILPDLCASHLQQLGILMKNHNQLCDITRRVIKAKNELSFNLFHRLKWVVYMENHLLELDSRLVFSFENLQALQRQLDILQQVHVAPATYLSAVVEVVRRRRFSTSFLVWASELACHLLTIYNEELTRRKEFQSTFDGHFLSSLFSGMDDLPPNFATQAPSIFDSALPKLCEDDIEKLKKELPDLAENLTMPNIQAITNFFMLRSIKDDAVDKICEEVNVVDDIVAGNVDQKIEGEPQNPIPHLKDLDKGCESETDTEEFEKVSQSPFELNFEKGSVPSPRPGSQDAATITEENLQMSRSDYEKVKGQYLKLIQLVRVTLEQLKAEFIELKSQFISNKTLIEQHCESLGSSWENIIIERDNREKELIERITNDHELEISDFRKIAQGKNEEIKTLKELNNNLEEQLKRANNDNIEIKLQLEKNQEQIINLEKQLDELQIDKEKALKELTDRLKMEHRGEIENIRARFKLMTMERSPSESSLEKIESNMNEVMLMQMKDNFESEKEFAINDAISKEQQKWQKIIEDLQIKYKQENEMLIEELTKQINDDKDKQIDILREQNKNLTLECLKHKSTIQQLAESEVSQNSDLLDKIDLLEKEKKDVESELDKLKREKSVDMSGSVSICEGKMDASTSPLKQHRRKDTPPRIGKLCIDSCRPGEIVLILWDENHQNFKILQDSLNMYFLHSDCFESLGLEICGGVPNKTYCYAEVVEKEYCHAKKSVNRFKLPKGTKFFRVRVKSAGAIKEFTTTTTSTTTTATASSSSATMTQSQTVTSSDIVIESTTSLPSSPARAHSLNWEPSIPEEKGGETTTPVGDVEKGKEVTENFQEEAQGNDMNIQITKSIDRSRICVVS